MVGDADLAELTPQVAAWHVVEVDHVLRLRRRFAFDDFAQALFFASRVGAVAEAQDHHPALLVEWGGVTVEWWTHAIGGLHRNDFVMAAKTDELYGGR
jgi:4a-hydroxytetrahydrobiopterin dehydratase